MQLRKILPAVILSTLVLAAVAYGGRRRDGAVATVREGGSVEVHLEGDAAADLFEYLSESIVPQWRVNNRGEDVAIVWGDNVTCAHVIQHIRRLRFRDHWVCRVDVNGSGQVRAASASSVYKIIGVEN